MFQRKFKIFLGLTLTTLLGACGGGGGGGGGVDPVAVTPTLADATSCKDYIDRFASESTKAIVGDCEANFENLPDAIVYANGMNPIEADSEYTIFISPSETRFSNLYPTAVGKTSFYPGPYDMVYELRSLALVSGAVGGGNRANVYWGVKDAIYREIDGALIVSVALIEDTIISLDGKDLYRAERLTIGSFCPVGEDCGDGIVASFPGEYLRGNMRLTLTEKIDPSTAGDIGDVILQYDVIVRRDDKPTGYPGY